MMNLLKGIFFLSLLVMLVGCGSEPLSTDKKTSASVSTSQYPLKIKNVSSNMEERELVFNEAPERVIAVWQNSIETLIALGMGDKIIVANGLPGGESLRAEYQEAYQKIPTRSLRLVDRETLIALKPNFILGWYSTFSEKEVGTTSFWQSRGVNTYIAKTSAPITSRYRLEDEFQYIQEMGRIFAVEAKADLVVSEMKNQIAETVKKSACEKPPTVMIVEVTGKNFRTYGGKTLAGDIVEKLNGKLLPSESNIGKENLLEANPDVIFVVILENQYQELNQVFATVKNDPALQSLSSIKNNRIYPLPLYLIYCSGIRSSDAIREISKGLYPEL